MQNTFMAVGLGRTHDTTGQRNFPDAVYEFTVIQQTSAREWNIICSVEVVFENRFGTFVRRQPRIIRHENTVLTCAIVEAIKPTIKAMVLSIDPQTTLAM